MCRKNRGARRLAQGEKTLREKEKRYAGAETRQGKTLRETLRSESNAGTRGKTRKRER